MSGGAELRTPNTATVAVSCTQDLAFLANWISAERCRQPGGQRETAGVSRVVAVDRRRCVWAERLSIRSGSKHLRGSWTRQQAV